MAGQGPPGARRPPGSSPKTLAAQPACAASARPGRCETPPGPHDHRRVQPMDRRGQGAAQAVVMAGQAGRGGRVPGRRGHRRAAASRRSPGWARAWSAARAGPLSQASTQPRWPHPQAGACALSSAVIQGRGGAPIRRPGGWARPRPDRAGPRRRPSGARDHRAGHRRAGPGAVDGLGQREAAGIAGQGQRRAQPVLRVGLQGRAVQAGRLGVPDPAAGVRGTRAAQAHGRPGSGSGGPAARRQGRQRRQGGAAVPGWVARRSRPTVRPTGSRRRASTRVPPGPGPGRRRARAGRAGGGQGAGVGRGRPPRPAAGAAGLGMLARCRC